VLAVNPSVQGYFISVCVSYFKGRVYHFLSFKTVSSWIIGRLSPVVWGTHGIGAPFITKVAPLNLCSWNYLVVVKVEGTNILVPRKHWNWSPFYHKSVSLKSVLSELFNYCLSGLFLVKPCAVWNNSSRDYLCHMTLVSGK
jgi:hypothetical protein